MSCFARGVFHPFTAFPPSICQSAGLVGQCQYLYALEVAGDLPIFRNGCWTFALLHAQHCWGEYPRIVLKSARLRCHKNPFQT